MEDFQIGLLWREVIAYEPGLMQDNLIGCTAKLLDKLPLNIRQIAENSVETQVNFSALHYK